VGKLPTLLDRLRARAAGADACVFVGFDFPIGLPVAYARRAGIDSFLEALPSLGDDFYDPAVRPDEVSLRRPFYPRRPGSAKQQHLLDGLGAGSTEELLRRCERRTDERPSASPLFWTLGPKAVGKAAITGWRDVLAPALRDSRLDLSLWPFDGRLDDLFAPGRVVVAETYPTEVYGHLGVGFAGTRKADPAARAANGRLLLAWARQTGLEISTDLTRQLAAGFPGAGGDDRFDAVVGLFGMLNVVLNRRGPGDPDDELVRRVEGWILGQGGAASAGDKPQPRGWSFSSLEELGEGPGFRKIREALGITAFGANALVLPPGIQARPHYHDEQDELYFVHRGRARFQLPGETRELGPGGLCHVESTTPRVITSVGDEELVLVIVGAKDGYVGRDGHLADASQLG
jgi:quercetin dioxygenase-like cupin family protein